MAKKKEKITETQKEAPKQYFVSDPERADRSFDLGSLGIVKLGSGEFAMEVTKEQADALKAFDYLTVIEK